MSPRRVLALSVSTLAALAVAPLESAQAQLATGTIAMASLDPNQITLFDPLTGNTTPYGLVNTTGLGSTTNVNSILWDSTQPTTFILGGEGFIGRLTITGPFTSTYSLITNSIGIVSQLSFDANHLLVVIDSTSDQVVRVNPLNGAQSAVTLGAQPWGADLNAGAVDPNTGDIFVGANNSLYRIPNGQSVGTLLSSGWSGGSAFCTGITFDPFTTDLFVSILTADRIVRMNRTTGAITDLCVAHSIQSCNSIAVDENGDIVVGGWQNKLYRLANAGGVPTLFGQATGQGILATSVDVVRPFCNGSAVEYGTGCKGTALFIPHLTLDGCPEPNGTVTLEITKGLGGSTALLFFGLNQAAIPLGGGCLLRIFPILGSPVALPLSAGGPGGGQITIPAFIPGTLSNVSFTMQAFVIDPGALFIGASASNGVQVTIP